MPGYFHLVPPGQDPLFRCKIFLKLALMERSGTLGIRINISAASERAEEARFAAAKAAIETDPGRELLHPPRRKILPLLQSGAIYYTLPGFRYAPPWAIATPLLGSIAKA